MTMHRISIIIATWNAEKTLQCAFDSIIPQLNEYCELIIIDGNSNDATLSIIKHNQEFISYWLSEPDKGIYDAWNKGINHCKGEWIMFMGADDILLPNTIKIYQEFIIKENLKGVNVISSRLNLVDENGNHKRYVGEPFDAIKYSQRKCSFAHPGLLHHKSLFQKYGNFSLEYKICSDCEFFIRNRNHIQSAFVDNISVQMQQGGMSVSYAALKEGYAIRKKYQTISKWSNFRGFVINCIKLKLSPLKSLYLNFFNRHVNS